MAVTVRWGLPGVVRVRLRKDCNVDFLEKPLVSADREPLLPADRKPTAEETTNQLFPAKSYECYSVSFSCVRSHAGGGPAEVG